MGPDGHHRPADGAVQRLHAHLHRGRRPDVPGLPVDVSVQGKATFTTDISNAALDLTVDGKADIQPIGVGIGLAGFVHFDFAKNSDGSLTPSFTAPWSIQPSGLDQLQSIGLNVEDAFALVRFNTTQDDHSTDLQVPNLSTPTHVWIPAHSGSLEVNGTAAFQVAGQQLFQIHGELDAYFNYDKGTNDFELDALLAASLILGPPASPVVTFMADGFLQFTSKGVAADFSLTFDAGDSTALKKDGLDLGSADNKFKLGAEHDEDGRELHDALARRSDDAQADGRHDHHDHRPGRPAQRRRHRRRRGYLPARRRHRPAEHPRQLHRRRHVRPARHAQPVQVRPRRRPRTEDPEHDPPRPRRPGRHPDLR